MFSLNIPLPQRPPQPQVGAEPPSPHQDLLVRLPDLPGTIDPQDPQDPRDQRDQGGSRTDSSDRSESPEPTRGKLLRWAREKKDVKKLEEFLAKHHFEDEGDSVPSSPWRPLCLARTPELFFPMHTASQEGNLGVVHMLLQQKVDPQQKTSRGRTALDVAKASCTRRELPGHLGIISLLQNSVQFLSVRDLKTLKDDSS